MPSIKNITALLRSMKPRLMNENFVFCAVSEKECSRLRIAPLLLFREKEGIAVIVEKAVADAHSFTYRGVWAMITLTVHSDLSAVGFLAIITAALAECGISVNVVSAYHHDHLFVPLERAEEAMRVLHELSASC